MPVYNEEENLPLLHEAIAKVFDEHNIDGTVLQLASFVLQEFFRSNQGGRREAPFQNLQALAGNILQVVFEPFLDLVKLPPKKKEEE